MIPFLLALVAAIKASTGPLLTRDPNDASSPAVFEGTRNQSPPVYPAVTFRVPGDKPDKRFRPTEAEGGGASPMTRQTVEIEAWSRSKSALQVEAIADALVLALEGQTLLLPSGAGRIFDICRDLRTGSLWDDTTNSWFILLRFSFLTQTF